MIFQIVETASGIVRTTVSAPSDEVARRYLEEGQHLFRGGPLALDRNRLMVVDGVLVQRPYVGPAPDEVLQGDGDTLQAIARG